MELLCALLHACWGRARSMELLEGGKEQEGAALMSL